MPDIDISVELVKRVVVEVAAKQGPAGPPGTGGGNHQHTQNVASDTWVVNHNLGFRPNIMVTTLGGVEVEANVVHISINQVQVQFDLPATGLALCS